MSTHFPFSRPGHPLAIFLTTMVFLSAPAFSVCAQSVDQDIIHTFMKQGKAAFDAGDCGRAQIHFNQVLIMAPEHEEARKYLGLCSQKYNDRMASLAADKENNAAPTGPSCSTGRELKDESRGLFLCIPDSLTMQQGKGDLSWSTTDGSSVNLWLMVQVTNPENAITALEASMRPRGSVSTSTDSTEDSFINKFKTSANAPNDDLLLIVKHRHRLAILLSASCASGSTTCRELMNQVTDMARTMVIDGWDHPLFNRWHVVFNSYLVGYAYPGSNGSRLLAFNEDELFSLPQALGIETGWSSEGKGGKIYLYNSRKQLWDYTRENKDFTISGANEVHMVVTDEDEVNPVANAVAAIYLTGVWGETRHLWLKRGLARMLSSRVARSKTSPKPYPIASLLGVPQERWAQEMDGEAADFCAKLVSDFGWEAVHAIWEATDPEKIPPEVLKIPFSQIVSSYTRP